MGPSPQAEPLTLRATRGGRSLQSAETAADALKAVFLKEKDDKEV